MTFGATIKVLSRRAGAGGLLGLNGLMAGVCALASLIVGGLAVFLFASLLLALAGAPLHPPSPWRLNSTVRTASCVTSSPDGCTPVYNPPAVSHLETANGVVDYRPPAAPKAPARLSGAALGVAALALAIGELPLFALAYGLARACLCFVEMAKGRFFAGRTVRHLRGFAVGGLIFVLGLPHAQALSSGAIRLCDQLAKWLTHGPHDGISASMNLSLTGVSNILITIYAVTLVVIAAVMVKASRLAEDHAQIV